MTDQEAVDLLHGMLQIESLSGHEGAHASFLAGVMARLGYTRAYVDAAGNVIGEMGPATASSTVVLLGHQDTVPGRIPVGVREGRLYGRGSVDAKGPLATFVTAVARRGPLSGTRYVVVGAVEEEAATSRGARAIGQRFLNEGIPDACVIGEPSGWDRITLGYKGRLLADLRVEGPCGHSAGDRSGVNEQAVAWWTGVVDQTQAFNAGRAGPFQQLLPSLRGLHSGSDGLVEWAELRVGLRLPTGLLPADLEARLHGLLDGVVTAPAQADLVCSGYEPAFVADKNTPLVRALLAAVRQHAGKPAFLLKTGTSDMNVVGPLWNCPILAYGPGDSRLDHTPEEHVVIAEYLRAIAVLGNALGHLPRHHPEKGEA
jgi:LysW-gamma-L-lysine carboxypeptidase